MLDTAERADVADGRRPMSPGNYVKLPCGTVRRVAAVRGDVLHFFAVVKQADGRTHYWASAKECVRWLPPLRLSAV